MQTWQFDLHEVLILHQLRKYPRYSRIDESFFDSQLRYQVHMHDCKRCYRKKPENFQTWKFDQYVASTLRKVPEIGDVSLIVNSLGMTGLIFRLWKAERVLFM